VKLWESAGRLAEARAQVDHLIDDELAESFIELRRAVRGMQWPSSAEMFPVLREIAWWANDILEALEAPKFSSARSQLKDAAPLIGVLTEYSSVTREP
jgi:hypothetical protein